MPYHPVVERIRTVLEEKGVWFETFEHEPVRTSEEASKIRTGYSIQQGAKAIIVRAKESGKGKRFVMFVLPGDRRFDTSAIARQFNLTDIRFATEVEVGELTGGVLPGGVPPFGNLFGLEVYVDEVLLQQERIVFNAGDRRYSIAMKSKDYTAIVLPRIGLFTQTSRF